MNGLLKRFLFLFLFLFLGCGCRNFMFSHNENMVADGKVTRFGVGGYGLIHVKGLVAIQAVRENTEMIIESSDGDSFGNPSAQIKGIRVIRFRTGPQVTGYLVDLAEKNDKLAKKYIGKMGDLNKAQYSNKLDSKGEVEDGN